jgi:hypothetical protein
MTTTYSFSNQMRQPPFALRIYDGHENFAPKVCCFDME